MSLLTRITAKAYHELVVYDLNSIPHDIKVLNFTTTGTRTSKLDRQCIVDVDTTITEGMQLNLPDNKSIIVSYKQSDIYRGHLIRYTLDCIDCTHKVNIVRTTLIKSKQGGLVSQQDTTVYTDIAVKIGVTDVVENKKLNQALPSYVMYLSKDYQLEVGDRIVVTDTAFEVAKVESFIHVTPGLMEVRFDKDPRWL